jgi:hypothetical protein
LNPKEQRMLKMQNFPGIYWNLLYVLNMICLDSLSHRDPHMYLGAEKCCSSKTTIKSDWGNYEGTLIRIYLELKLLDRMLRPGEV